MPKLPYAFIKIDGRDSKIINKILKKREKQYSYKTLADEYIRMNFFVQYYLRFIL